jgi:hypothetical protein
MKKIGWLLLISLILFSVLEGSGWADLGIEAWTETYDGGYGNDYGQDITFDSLGNVIIAGYVTGDPGPPDHVTNAYAIKYTPAGVEDWSVEFDSGPIGEGGGQDGHDSFYDVAVDSLNNMIFVGSRAEIWPTVPTNQSLFIQKYNSSGLNLQWEERWYGYGWVGAQGVAVDASDNIYVAGSDFVDWGSTQGAWLTMKYNSAGVISLGPIYYDYNNYSFLQDRAYDVTLDSEGNIISVGVLGVSGCDGCLYNDGDWHVRKYDSAGTLVWEDTYSGAANLIDYAVGVDVDSSNNVIVCGYSNKGTDNSTNADYDWLVIKYAKNGDGGVGQRLWTYTYESTMGRSEMASAVKIDQSDNIFVVGSENLVPFPQIDVEAASEPVGFSSRSLLNSICGRFQV